MLGTEMQIICLSTRDEMYVKIWGYFQKVTLNGSGGPKATAASSSFPEGYEPNPAGKQPF